MPERKMIMAKTNDNLGKPQPVRWNEPDDNRNQNNGWDGDRRGGRDQGPPDLDEAISRLLKKFSGFFGGRGGGSDSGDNKFGGGKLSSGLVIGILVIVGIIW